MSWPLTDAEYQARQEASRPATLRPRGCDCVGCTAVHNYGLLYASGPRPGETREEYEQVLREAAASVARRFDLDLGLRG